MIATRDTRHYSFTAVGRTKAEAVEALKKGWRAYCFRRCGRCKPGQGSLYTVREFLGENNENVQFLRAMVGHCYAEDGERLT
jgi:hypothetical protein